MFPEPQAFNVVVSHPAHQGVAYRLAEAVRVQGFPLRLLTGYYYRPAGPGGRTLRTLPKTLRRPIERKLAARHHPSLPDDVVLSVSGPCHLLLQRAFAATALGNAIHDAAAARWLARHMSGASGAVHGFVGVCEKTLLAAKAAGLGTVVEITSPPWKEAILVREYARLGLHYPDREPPARRRREVALADHVVTQSPFAAELLQAHGISPERIVLNPLGVDLELFHPVADGAPGKTFRVLFVGHLSPHKGLHVLLDAWRRWRPRGAELVLVGSSTRTGEQLLRESGVHCRRLGRLDRIALAETYRSSDVFVCPALAEGGPLVVLEAMASGLPCVVSRGARSVLRDREEGFVVDIGDAEALAARLHELHADPGLRARMSEAARARASQFSWQAYNRRCGHFYDALASGRGCRHGIWDLT